MNQSFNSLIRQAIEHFQRGNFAQAETSLHHALQIEPENFDALHIMGVVCVVQDRHTEAAEFFRKALAINPGSCLANYNLAASLSASGDDLAALPHHEQAVQLAPGNQDAWVNYGKSLANLKRHDEALNCYQKAIGIDPNHVQAIGNQGALLAELGRNEEALACFEKALAAEPNHPAVWLNMANTLRSLKRLEEALAHYERAIQLDPKHADSWSNKGNALANLKRHDEALAHYDRAIALAPDNADAWYNKGYVLNSLKRYDEALAHYDKAIQLTPGNVDAWHKKSIALNELKRYDEALEHYDRAIQIDPDHDFLYGDRLGTQMSICDWRDAESQLRALAKKIDSGKNAATPFIVLSTQDSLALQKKTAERYARNFPPNHSLGPIPKHPAREKIRIGYFSHDFREHATAFLTAELFEKHDRSKFEIIALSFGPDKTDRMRARLLATFDRFVDIRDKSDHEAAQIARELGIDIAVDLQGYQTQHRPGIFAYRAAPIQVNYLAFPGTMGAEYMDYIIADNTLIPPESYQYYSEKIVFLPNSYQPNDRQRAISDRKFTRKELGLPQTGFVFCCFNTNYKITPRTFDGWMNILKAVDGSVLWLFEGSPELVRNLRKEALDRGIAADRLVFAGYMNLPDHLARHRLADLFLDTLPYGAHTTGSDALWAGLPVLTCIGESFASRVSASLLNAIHLPELITHSQEDYERLAIELATHPARLTEIKQKLAKNRLTTPLFDTSLYAKHLEAAYTTMVELYQADLPPEHIYVASGN